MPQGRRMVSFAVGRRCGVWALPLTSCVALGREGTVYSSASEPPSVKRGALDRSLRHPVKPSKVPRTAHGIE